MLIKVISVVAPIGLYATTQVFNCAGFDDQTLPHPTDCTRFINCAHEVAYEFPCPPRTFFDPTDGVMRCTFDSEAKCTAYRASGFDNCKNKDAGQYASITENKYFDCDGAGNTTNTHTCANTNEKYDAFKGSCSATAETLTHIASNPKTVRIQGGAVQHEVGGVWSAPLRAGNRTATGRNNGSGGLPDNIQCGVYSCPRATQHCNADLECEERNCTNWGGTCTVDKVCQGVGDAVACETKTCTNYLDVLGCTTGEFCEGSGAAIKCTEKNCTNWISNMNCQAGEMCEGTGTGIACNTKTCSNYGPILNCSTSDYCNGTGTGIQCTGKTCANQASILNCASDHKCTGSGASTKCEEKNCSNDAASLNCTGYYECDPSKTGNNMQCIDPHKCPSNWLTASQTLTPFWNKTGNEKAGGHGIYGNTWRYFDLPSTQSMHDFIKSFGFTKNHTGTPKPFPFSSTQDTAYRTYLWANVETFQDGTTYDGSNATLKGHGKLTSPDGWDRIGMFYRDDVSTGDDCAIFSWYKETVGHQNWEGGDADSYYSALTEDGRINVGDSSVKGAMWGFSVNSNIWVKLWELDSNDVTNWDKLWLRGTTVTSGPGKYCAYDNEPISSVAFSLW